MVVERGDRLLVELFRKGGRIGFRQRMYIPDAVPRNDGRNLTAISADGQKVHAALGNCALVGHEGIANTYDLEMLLLVERERQPEELQVMRPLFAWVEVKTQNADQGPTPLMARLENEYDFPSAAYKVRVWNWPGLPGENALRSPARPAINIWTRHDMPRDPFQKRRVAGKTVAECFEGQTFTMDEKQIK